MAGDDFLSRWSRRKREVTHAEVLDEPAIPAPLPDVAVLTVPTDEDILEEDALSDEAIAALPSLDSLTAETDLTQFLRAGVPQVLRNAAMRRMWSIDPSIRDYLCEAREYAFDWHIPGAVPGTGPMLPTDDIAGMVRDVFAGSKPQVIELPADEDASEDGKDDVPSPAQADMKDELQSQEVQARELLAQERLAQDIRTPDIAATAESPLVAADGVRQVESRTETTAGTTGETALRGRLRRHGGAFPI